jgi:UDP-xylose/UDP-N-acetylglucosamine transporter B4
MVILFWSLSMMNNLALDFNIDMPLHIVFKSGGLMINMFLGWLMMSKKYTLSQIASVITVSLGVLISTYSSAFDSTSSSSQTSENGANGTKKNLYEWTIGIVLLCAALVMSSLLGLYQEHTYKKYGKQWREGLFYTHFLGLPFFYFIRQDIYDQAMRISHSPTVSILDFFSILGLESYLGSIASIFASIRISQLWLILIVNAFTQYICISGVHKLSTISSSLSVNLVLTFRKFLSLIISVYYFQADFTLAHVCGTVLVFAGTMLYSIATSIKHKYDASSSTHHKKAQ